MRSALAATILAAILASSPRARADEEATEPRIHPTLAWVLTQFIPSPSIAAGEGTARFGARWQITPLLYSFGINRRLSPWRVLVVEPIVRQSGSVELFIGPEHYAYGESFIDGWLVRTGVRSYFPLVEKGDYLSVSLGAAHTYFAGKSGAAIEAGAYVLFGVVGAQIAWSPTGGPAETIATLRFRYF